MMVKSAAAGSGPDVSPIATSHVTSVCDDGEQTGAHKVILDFCLMLMLVFLLLFCFFGVGSQNFCQTPVQSPKTRS